MGVTMEDFWPWRGFSQIAGRIEKLARSPVELVPETHSQVRPTGRAETLATWLGNIAGQRAERGAHLVSAPQTLRTNPWTTWVTHGPDGVTLVDLVGDVVDPMGDPEDLAGSVGPVDPRGPRHPGKSSWRP